MPEVIVVGAGPTGLWLAAELQSVGIQVLVLEQRETRDPRSRAAAMAAGTLETFATRRIAQKFIDTGKPIYSVHFGASSTRLQFTDVLGTKHPHSLIIPQAATERILAEHCRALGVDVRFNHCVVDLSQTANRVAITTESSAREVSTFSASWVIGCDGTRSVVRKFAEIDFPGTDSDVTGWLADVLLTSSLPGPVAAKGPNGHCIGQELGDGKYYRFVGLDFATMHLPPSNTPTLEMVKAWVSSTLGTDFGMHSPIWISRFGNATRLASKLRSGRVFVAGDAAHQFFPAGGQGINTGLQDAANLAWKLVAVVQSRITGANAERLLDSYEKERRPAIEAVIRNTNAQTALFVSQKPREVSLCEVVSEMLTNPDLNVMWARRVTGFADPFPKLEEKQDGLIGSRVTHLNVHSSPDGLHSVMAVDSFILISVDWNIERAVREVTAPWRSWISFFGVSDQVDAFGDQWKDVKSVLIRPDARIAWVWKDTYLENIAASLVPVLKSICMEI